MGSVAGPGKEVTGDLQRWNRCKPEEEGQKSYAPGLRGDRNTSLSGSRATIMVVQKYKGKGKAVVELGRQKLELRLFSTGKKSYRYLKRKNHRSKARRRVLDISKRKKELRDMGSFRGKIRAT